jgi:serine/threonine-protein kinase
MPVLTADAGTPRMPVTPAENYCSGGPDCDAVPAEMPVPEGATIEGSTDLTCDVASQDCHLLVADTAARRLYELYQGTRAGDRLAAGAFVVWDLDTAYTDQLRGPQCTSADAAGFPIAALTATADEVASGRIDHALRFILPNDRMKAGVYVPPATHAGGPQSADRTTRAKWADLGIEAQSFAALTVDDFEVVDHGPEVPSTYECARN